MSFLEQVKGLHPVNLPFTLYGCTEICMVVWFIEHPKETNLVLPATPCKFRPTAHCAMQKLAKGTESLAQERVIPLESISPRPSGSVLLYCRL